MTTYWTCIGEVRGECGVKHRTEQAAQKCCDRDNRDCKRGHGPRSYSDRYPEKNESDE
jgi:hypothetical protein